jgi:hypothetical protein
MFLNYRTLPEVCMNKDKTDRIMVQDYSYNSVCLCVCVHAHAHVYVNQGIQSTHWTQTFVILVSREYFQFIINNKIIHKM